MYYFVRVNGATLHNNPGVPSHFVPGEPPRYPQTRFNVLDECLEQGFVRIGWPDTGDLKAPSKTGALAKGYTLSSLPLYVQNYLRTFVGIAEKSVILMPDTNRPGTLYLGKVTKPYHYFHNIPDAPYEHSHRLGVEWLKDEDGKPLPFEKHNLNIGSGGFWMRAFHDLNSTPTGRAAIPFIAKQLKEG